MKQILCFGDSNTWGLIPGTKSRYDWNVRWTSRLQEKLGHTSYRVIEEGLCGRTTIFEDELREGRRGVDFLPVLLESHGMPDVIVLMLGTNDCKSIYHASAELIGKGIERLLEQIRRQSPDSTVLLVSPIRLGNGVGEEGYDPEFDEHSVQVSMELPKVYQRIARERGLAYLAASDVARPSEVDREHLDATGHADFAQAVYEKLCTLLAA